MNIDLTGKTALVCGASQGLGAAIAKELAVLGANIILIARNEDKLKTILASLDISKQQQHIYFSADTSATDELKNKIQTYLAGQNHIIHILINNTGGPPPGPLIDTKAEEIEKAFRSHLLTAHVLTHLVTDGMKRSGYGRIINIVSTSIKQPIPGLGISNTVRAAVANWGKTLSSELAKFGITVNNVLPGSIKTARLDDLFTKQAASSATNIDEIIQKNISAIPAGRFGSPEEFAAAVAFLCTPAAAYITGINLPVDGGKTLSL